MGFRDFEFADSAQKKRTKQAMSPVWRGVGCFLAIVLGLVGYLAAGWFLTANAQNRWIYLPPQIIRPAYVSSFLPPGFIVQIVVAFLFLLLSYGVLSFVYAAMFPKRPGEFDAKPLKRRRRRRGDPWRSRGR